MLFKRPLCLLCLFYMVGILLFDALGILDADIPSSNTDILEYIESHPNSVRIYGTVYKRTSDGSFCYLRDCWLQTQTDLLSLKNVKVYMEKTDTVFSVGSGVLMTGKLQKIPKAGNPGQFDSVLYYKTQHIYYRMVNAVGTQERILDFSFREQLARLRDKMAQTLEENAGDYAPVYEAMLLGDKSQLEEETKDRYQMAGMTHMLAISGLHLSLLGWGLFKLLQRLGAGIPPAGAAATVLLFAYGILTGEGVATMRALCMFSLSIIARIFGRTYDLLSATALSALFLLIDNPFYLYYSGFLLSFGCILGIGLVLPRLAAVFSPKNKRLANALSASTAIQLTTLPITLYFFYEFPVYGILLNLIAIPALSIVLACGFLTCLLGLFGAFISSLCILPGNLILFAYDYMTDFAGKLPMTTWITGQPHIWQIILYYLILILFFKIISSEKIKEAASLKLLISASLLLPVTAVLLLTLKKAAVCSITCLDVGQGDGIVVETPAGHHYLIDGGSSSQSEIGRYRLLPYLKSQGISALDFVWVSHTDSDHISGIQEILELQAQSRTSVSIKNLLLPKWKEVDENYEFLEQIAITAGVAVHYMQKGDTLQDGDVSWQVLSPSMGGTEDINESSQVLLLEYGEFQALFTGDIGEETELSLLTALPDIDFLKVAHHGSKYSTSEAFLAQTQPELAVISCSATNTYGHPSPDTLTRLDAAGSQIWCTKDSGAVTATVKNGKITVTGYLSTP